MNLASLIGIVTGVVVLLFGGRGAIDLIMAARARKSAARPAVTTEVPGETIDISTYMSRIIPSHARLRFGDPTASRTHAGGDPTAGMGISLSDIYTPLSVATEFGGNEALATRPVQLRIPVQEALAKKEARLAVILGDPGAGKSTLVDHLVSVAAEEGTLPVHVRLSEFGPSHGEHFWHAVLETYRDGTPDEFLCSALGEALSNRPGLVVFDGLDEVLPESVPFAVEAIVSATRKFPQAQVVVTCRSYDYYLQEPKRLLPATFVKLRLLPFSMDDMLSYVDRWYDALSELEFISNPIERKRNLQDSLRNSPALEGLGGTPLLLALMALVHTTEGELPIARAVLYYRAVTHLLADSPQWRQEFVSETIRPDEIINLAQAVAFEVHSREMSSGQSFDGLTIQEIEEIVKRQLASDMQSSADFVRARKAIDARVMRMVQSNGLLVEQMSGHFHFAHRSLQEFLAGLYFLNGNDYELALQLAGTSLWHEPFVLMAGYGGREGYSLFFLTWFIAELASQGPEVEGPLDRLLLAGEMLAEIGKETLKGKNFESLIEPPGAKSPLWWTIVDQLFEAHLALGSAAENVEVLQVLGSLGDPRFVGPDGGEVSVIDRLVWLSPLELTIGDEDPDRPKAKSDLVETSPVRRVHLDGFFVARYPVTNVEYAEFIDSGGYSDMSMWTSDGLKWLNGDAKFAAELKERTVDWIHRDYANELDTGKFRMEDILRDADDMSTLRREPFYWRNARYNQPNQPVVGVNWWEANAYCAWLTQRLSEESGQWVGASVSIPNEWQWERFARGLDDHRIFPWGNEPATGLHAHTRFDGLDLDAATPVGSFPLGKTNDGLLDVAGNVWEWTGSRALPMDEDSDPDRHSIESVMDVVVRGGSWFSDVDGAVRCGYRGIDLPQNVYYDVGFRIIVKLEQGLSR